ncbi:hypothetical protein AAFC00_003547 [Neodothiora populina]|uniref:Peptide N-acetyl-beta-D-glucosaminyl asparaginase amidase A N-terminal domain-containing protein n=1 Tax=Neodothiora populina TaxID=2781224 RepID=A0ABR3PEK0_9PEZI
MRTYQPGDAQVATRLSDGGKAPGMLNAARVTDPPNHNRANKRGFGSQRITVALIASAIVCLFWVLRTSFPVWSPWSCSESVPADGADGASPIWTRRSLDVVAPLLDVFQVSPPVLVVGNDGALELTDGTTNGSVELEPQTNGSCRETLLVHSFAYSYGSPHVGAYNPPSCNFNRVTWNLSVTSAGRQFDRLGIVYFGDIEVFRTSTAEPTATGIEWVYLKDMTSYSSLFREQQKIIFDLGNIVDSTYTASFNVTLTAIYFTASSDSVNLADLILPISAEQSANDAASVFTVPSDIASSNLSLPRNTLRAVLTVAATGQSNEEFWWSNVPSTNTASFPQTGALYGYSPFREVQLYIDGLLAGVVWPFPIIFTGGVVPGLWRPIVGIDAFDLHEDEIDITPWLGILCDGNSHNFTIRISGLSEAGNGTVVLSETTESYWLVTGKVFVWLDAEDHVTTGQAPIRTMPPPSFHMSSVVGQGPNGTNETLAYHVTAQREFALASTIRTSQGDTHATWHQSLSFSNDGNLTDAGNVQTNSQNTLGYDVSSSGYARNIEYPLWAYTAYGYIEDNFTITADLNRGKTVKTVGQSVFPTGLESFVPVRGYTSRVLSFQGASLTTTQNGSATYLANETSSTSFSFGHTEQDMVFSGIRVDASEDNGFPHIEASTELYHRYVAASNSTVVEDEENLVGSSVKHTHDNEANEQAFAAPGVRSMVGRGPSHDSDRRA